MGVAHGPPAALNWLRALCALHSYRSLRLPILSRDFFVYILAEKFVHVSSRGTTAAEYFWDRRGPFEISLSMTSSLGVSHPCWHNQLPRIILAGNFPLTASAGQGFTPGAPLLLIGSEWERVGVMLWLCWWLFVVRSGYNPHTHTHTHAHTHRQTHKHTQSWTHTDTNKSTQPGKQTHTLKHTHTQDTKEHVHPLGVIHGLNPSLHQQYYKHKHKNTR